MSSSRLSGAESIDPSQSETKPWPVYSIAPGKNFRHAWYRPLLATMLLQVPSAYAAVSAEQAASLGSSLTPLGAERAADSSGRIPAWTGGMATENLGRPNQAGWVEPFADETPLFTIGSADLATYAAFLPEGQQALLRKFPDYRLEIFPTHRTAAAPQSVYDATLRNATHTHAVGSGIGHGITDAAPGIPFPIPQNGTEIIWNHLLAYWGPARADRLSTYFMAADGTLDLTHRYRETVDFPYYDPARAPDAPLDFFFKRREISEAPATLAGRGYIQWQPLDLSRNDPQIWQAVPGQHRVRRSPALAYDTPTPDGAGIVSFDDYYVFSGAPDRYQFTLLGKRPMFVPYNNNRFATREIGAVAGPHHLTPDALRYELHRVWVVDATLLPGQHHLAPHRRFYIDEDSWFAVYCDAWDEDGKLWKFSQGTMFDIPQLPAVVLGSVTTYDIENGGYVLSFAFNGEAGGYHPTGIHPAATFAPESLAGDSTQ